MSPVSGPEAPEWGCDDRAKGALRRALSEEVAAIPVAPRGEREVLRVVGLKGEDPRVEDPRGDGDGHGDSFLTSVVAGHAVQRSAGAPLRVRIAMAVDTPAHAERADDRAGPDEVQQVVGDEVSQAVGPDARHALDGPV